MKNKYITSILLFISLFLVLGTTSVLAYELEWPNSPGGTSIGEGTKITTLVRYIYEWGVSIGILLAFVAIVVAGFTYMTSTGNANKIKEAQDNIKDAFIGLALLLSSWLILNTINPSLTNLVVPNIEYDMELGESGFKPADLPKGQCTKVVFWEEKNFTGKKREIVNFLDKETPFSFDNAFLGPAGEIIKYVTDFNPKSYIAYREMRTVEGEKEIDEKLCELYQAEDKTKLYCEGGFIKDDSCIVELYGASPSWDLINPCGDKLLSIPGAVGNVDRMLANPNESLDCYKIIKGDDE
ncbi:MAG TPA: pilin [Candidatus Pacearchaeota archaeon]|nr:pilin [Candidatus Pacearchaeota archaeon]